MAEAVKHIPFDEFAGDPEGVFERVIRKNETIMVERDSGETVIIRPLQKEEPGKPERTEADHEAFLSAAGGWSDFDLDAFLKNTYESRDMPLHLGGIDAVEQSVPMDGGRTT